MLDESIYALQERRLEYSDYSRAALNVNRQIKDTVDKTAFAFVGGDITRVYQLKDSIEQNLNIRNEMLLNDGGGSAKAKVDERRQYDAELERNVVNIYAREGGLVYSALDGMESKLTPDTMYDLSPEDTRQKADYAAMAGSRQTTGDEEVFKIIPTNEWYIAAYVPAALSIGWAEGGVRTIYIDRAEQSIPLGVTIHYIKRGERENYVIFKATKAVHDFMDMRDVKFKLTNSVPEGLKIPNSAIVEKVLLRIPNAFVSAVENPKEKMIGGIEPRSVIKKASEYSQAVLIYPQDRDEAYTYVLQDFNLLKLGDIITDANGQDYTLDDTTTVKGVFVINDGTARFRRITVDGEILDSGDYSVLNQSTNRLKVYDRIITDAKQIVDGQRVY
jgi:hypothetical protein